MNCFFRLTQRMISFGVLVTFLQGTFLVFAGEASLLATELESESLFLVADDGDDFTDPMDWDLDVLETGRGSLDFSAILQVSGLLESAEKSTARTRYPVGGVSFVWRDSTRRRSLPVRAYYPSVLSDQPWPVIIFSHGLGGGTDRCSYLGKAWAARGFVVLMIQHPGSDENVWKGKVRFRRELEDAFTRNWSGRTRATDIRFVLNRMDQMAGDNHWLASRWDRNRIGVGGYDLGALASLLVAGQLPPDQGPSLADSRIKAVLAMSPPVHRGHHSLRSAYAKIDVPALFISGTEDNGIVGTTKAGQRRIPFDFMGDSDRYLIIFSGADHQIYGGHYLSMRASKDKPFQAAITRISACFWLAHLSENPRALAVMKSRGLNSLVRISASVERRFADNEARQDESERNETSDFFPQTRLYRSIMQSY